MSNCDYERMSYDAAVAKDYLIRALPELQDPLEVRDLSFLVEYFLESNFSYLAIALAAIVKQELKKALMYDRALTVWGRDAQMDMVVEECAELIHAIQKFRREGRCDEAAKRVIEEVADVEIMCEQMRRMFTKHENQVEHVKDEKLRRLERMIREY